MLKAKAFTQKGFRANAFDAIQQQNKVQINKINLLVGKIFRIKLGL